MTLSLVVLDSKKCVGTMIIISGREYGMHRACGMHHEYQAGVVVTSIKKCAAHTSVTSLVLQVCSY
jgi:hypothetical protein